MGIAICDECIKPALGDLAQFIDKEYKFIFLTDCIVCETTYLDNFCIPDYPRDNEKEIDTVKKYLEEVKAYQLKREGD